MFTHTHPQHTHMCISKLTQMNVNADQTQRSQHNIDCDTRINKKKTATDPSGSIMCPREHQFVQTALSALTLFRAARANVNEFLFAYLVFFLC